MTNSAEQDRILSRIRKMMRLANDAGVKLRQSRSQSEAQGALARAAGAAFGNKVSLNRQVGTSGSNLKKLS
jgi:hypothetical protein